MVIVALINVFAGNIVSILAQMKRLPEVMKITAVVSNLNGSMDAGLKIKESYADGILNSEYVENPAFSIPFKFGFGEFSVENYLGRLNYYATAGNCVAAIPGMHEEEITMAESYTVDEFFKSNEHICMIDQHLLDEQNLKIGDTVTCTTFYYRYGQYNDIYIDPLEINEYTIVGAIDIAEYLGDGVRPDMIVPYEMLRDVYHQNGFEFYTDAASFQIKDPYKLNEFKEEMHDIGFLSVIFQAEFHYDGNALTVKDETFVRSAEQLIKSRNLFLGILPFVAIAVLCVGFVMAELLMKGRIAEYAIMRSLGQSHKESFFMLVAEYGFSALLGSIAGLLIGVLGLKTPIGVAALAAAAFFICYLVGTMAALSSLKKMSVMAVLSKND